MKIINPIYDQAFKYLMDNEQIAKKILSIILEQEVISLQSKPQEVKTHDPKRDIPLSRFDFKAIIRNNRNEEYNVLIEIQKSNKPDPIMRFRRYLGKNYIKQETYIDSKGIEQNKPLPIITIYFLGYELKEYDTPSIVVNNQVKDTVNDCIIENKDEFVQLLTHPSYILQITRLRPDRKTRIEKFLAIFDQAKISETKYILEMDEKTEDVDIESIKQYLHLATEDEEMILKLEFEEDVEKEFVILENRLETERKEKERAIAIAEQERKEKEQERKEKEQAQNKITSMIFKLHKRGFSIAEIAEDLELSAEEVSIILKKFNISL